MFVGPMNGYTVLRRECRVGGGCVYVWDFPTPAGTFRSPCVFWTHYGVAQVGLKGISNSSTDVC